MRVGVGRRVLAWALIACVGGAWMPALRAAPSDTSPTALDHYLDGLRTLHTDFTQTVTDSQGKSAAGGGGSLIVERPNRFRWDYRPVGASGDDSGQLLVADGRNVWFFDRELAQVTVKPIDAALSSTPIMLLSGSSDALRAQFDISTQPTQDGLQWVRVLPRGAQADFSEARLGFHGTELARMIVHNMLGQTVQLDFVHGQRNDSVDAAQFNFVVPSGVDVIGTPLPAQVSH